MNAPLGVLLVGCKGAVATTILAAWHARRLGLELPCPLPSQADELFSELPLEPLENMVFAGWDIDPQSFSAAAATHACIPQPLLRQVGTALDSTTAYPACQVDEPGCPPRLEQAQRLVADIARFPAQHDVAQLVVIDLASTERFAEISTVHQSVEAFEQGLADDHAGISAGMIYAWAAIRSGCPFVNFTPSLTSDIPALEQLALRLAVPLAGKDGKTGQTLYKTVLAPMLRQRNLRVQGWYSTNILGNRDGEVLDRPQHRATKVASKASSLSSILGYDDFDHQVHIHYYPPRGDFKEAWDVVDFAGWMGIPMQIRVNWQASDSALAAPLVVDLARWMQLFAAGGESGFLPQLASYFKSPQGSDENDFHRQGELLRAHVRERYLG